MYDGYIRVSKMGDRDEGDESFQSVADQRAEIESFAAASGLEILVHPPELDVTGSKLQRPILDAIVAKIVARRSEGLIVAKVNRLSRAGLGDAIKLVETIHDAGAAVGFAELGPIDPRTPTGEMIVNMWLSIARMQWRQYQDAWLSSRKKGIERGAVSGPVPIGLSRHESGRFMLGEDAPEMRHVFEIAGTAGMQVALEYCRLTWPARYWNMSALRQILASRVYLGEVRSGEIVARGVIPALVDERTWYRAQHKATPRAPSGDYPLSGIARCAGCGGPLVGHMSGRGVKQRSYRCIAPSCTRRVHLRAQYLEEIVGEAIRADASRLTAGSDAGELERLERVREAAEAELERYVLDTEAAAVIGAELWRKGLDARQESFATTQSAYEQALAAPDMPDLDNPNVEDLRRVVIELSVRAGRSSSKAPHAVKLAELAERVTLQLA
jgi:site-specific DNA recombinase